MKIKGNIQIVIAIVVAALIIGGAIMLSNKQPSANKPVDGVPTDTTKATGPKAVSAEDHIRGGNIDSKVKVIEFSDTECPFCKRFHQTTTQLSQKYGDKVAFVYRHFPLTQLHQQATTEAHATECAFELGGNEKFWQFLDKIYEITPSNDGLDLAQLPVIAKQLGLDEAKFNECQKSEKHMGKIEASFNDGVSAGAKGTPFTVILGPNGAKEIISGAQPSQTVEKVIDAMLAL